MSGVLRAARALGDATALLVTAGAGMGVDSGLPDFRGDRGFWRAYPPYEKLGLSFSDLANPRWFDRDPEFAWGFYGHRLALYRRTAPHEGFAILRRLVERIGEGFVFTSNVDGQFQRAGFDPDRILEVHGAIDHVQCTAACGVGILSADPFAPEVDETTFRARPPLPTCPRCGALLRPNILMFGDADWDDARAADQHARFGAWVRRVVGPRLVVVECGAGTAIPTVRGLGEQLARAGATLVRINVREPQDATISIATGALDALRAIEQAISDT
jgi:NAD-dependent SIR2 family protein deacetylase